MIRSQSVDRVKSHLSNDVRTFGCNELVNGACFEKDGITLRCSVYAWDVATQKDHVVSLFLKGHGGDWVQTPDGKLLVSAGISATVMFWDVPAGAPKGVRRNMSLPPAPPPPGFDRTRGTPPPP